MAHIRLQLLLEVVLVPSQCEGVSIYTCQCWTYPRHEL